MPKSLFNSRVTGADAVHALNQLSHFNGASYDDVQARLQRGGPALAHLIAFARTGSKHGDLPLISAIRRS
jgi:hypothetical protein